MGACLVRSASARTECTAGKVAIRSVPKKMDCQELPFIGLFVWDNIAGACRDGHRAEDLWVDDKFWMRLRALSERERFIPRIE